MRKNLQKVLTLNGLLVSPYFFTSSIDVQTSFNFKGNKTDTNSKAVPTSEAQEFAKSKGMEFYEVSALSAGIELFEYAYHHE